MFYLMCTNTKSCHEILGSLKILNKLNLVIFLAQNSLLDSEKPCFSEIPKMSVILGLTVLLSEL